MDTESIGHAAENTPLRRRFYLDPEINGTNSVINEEKSPLPSVISENDISMEEDELNLMTLAHHAVDQAEEAVKKFIQASWNVCHFSKLPEWLQDNDFLTHGHRPPLPSFRACFKSIFRVHTETGNIWTHLLGCIVFIGIAANFLIRPDIEIRLQEKIVFGFFFAGAIICLGFSFAFHTVTCHSQCVNKVFSKLDYCGISLLIMGSFVPWLYYGFYCHFQQKVIYLICVCTLGAAAILVSMMDKFSEPAWRSFRAGVFITFGLSSVVPVIHYGFIEGWLNKVSQKSVAFLALMGFLYIAGALLYAVRVPERFFPGKFDIWLHLHQIFHIFVIGAALVHFYGVSELAMHRVTVGECEMISTLVQ